MNLVITVEEPTHPDAALLIQHLSAELGALYGDDGSGKFAPADVQVPRAAFVVARADGVPVACGAIRPFEDDPDGTAEVKRMYVEPSMRGRGISRRILQYLESLACNYGYHTLILETGERQTAAIGLYEKSGYQRIPNYAPYTHRALSRCFAKKLERG
jgi:GNAT superfamily N-acetyltransferase